MVFPSGRQFSISGMAEPRKQIFLEFGSISATADVDDSGSWFMNVPPVKAGLKGRMVFRCGSDSLVVHDVVSGDVWLCSGQSNMAMNVSRTNASISVEKDIENKDVRYFTGKEWIKVSKDNAHRLSAMAVYFAIGLFEKQGNPVGIIVAARGGTSIDAWLPPEAFPSTKEGNYRKTLINDPEVIQADREDKLDFRPAGEHRLAKWGLGRAIPSALYTELIIPRAEIPVTGILWYQGESNAANKLMAKEYKLWLKALIKQYRLLWNRPDLPVVIVQLPEYNPGAPEKLKAWNTLRKIQRKVVLHTEHTALADLKGLGDLNDIHPYRKKEAGLRSAGVALELMKNK